MKQVIVFGAGAGGAAAYEGLKDQFVVRCFADNSADRQREPFCGLPVIAPADVPKHPSDLVVIASVHAVQIARQLTGLGVAEDRIHSFDVNLSDPPLHTELAAVEQEITQLATERCPKVIVFGTGSRAKSAWEHLTARFEVVAFADNDPKKQGSTWMGRQVIRPDDIPNQQFDRVVVASIYTREILAQLNELGVARWRIQCF